MRALVGRQPGRTLARIAALTLLVVIVFKLVLVPIRIEGISMSPTYRDGAINAINKLAYQRHPPRRGDVVGIRYAGQKVMLLKRIIALPGERVAIHAGTVYIDGEPLREDYLQRPPAPWNCAEVVLEPDEFFVIGDNRQMPDRQHLFGKADRRRIIGKVLF
jgi:signal peptidase I